MPKYVHKAKLSYADILQNPPKKCNFMSPRPKSAIGIKGDATTLCVAFFLKNLKKKKKASCVALHVSFMVCIHDFHIA